MNITPTNGRSVPGPFAEQSQSARDCSGLLVLDRLKGAHFLLIEGLQMPRYGKKMQTEISEIFHCLASNKRHSRLAED